MEDQDAQGSIEMPIYLSRKKVWALKIKSVDTNCSDENKGALLYFEDGKYAAKSVSQSYIDKHKPERGGYYVVYKGGYESFSPEEPFELGNLPLNNEASYNFGEALLMLQGGYKVMRKGWNGSGIFIELQSPDENSKMTSPYIFIDTTGLESDNKSAPRSRVPWLASQTDMLSYDWMLVI